uniref:Peptidase A2 domain-containing protein n=1 Tax=Xiphophorus couchianus TaxID=32473 RepID=A0A3B5M0X8_9TELE
MPSHKLSDQTISVVGFSGVKQTLPLSTPLHTAVGRQKVTHPFVCSPSSPVNLLGRDLLIALGATILCGPDGLLVTFPDGSSHACSPVYTHGQFLLQQAEEQLADIYWGRIQPEKTDHAGILSCFLLWKPWIQALAPYGPTPDLPHVTLFYDRDQTEWFQEQFETHLAGVDWTVFSQDIYVAPEGVAAAVDLTHDQSFWYKMQDEAVPHISLALHPGHQARELGGVVKRSLAVSDWQATVNTDLFFLSFYKHLQNKVFWKKNLWLNWMGQTAKETNIGNCIACATARPHLFTEPAPLHLGDSWGFNCMLRLTTEADPVNCDALAKIYPPINNYTQTGTFLPVKGKGLYVCFNFTHLKPDFNLGQISSDWCNVTLPAAGIGSWARAGLYYFCGGDRLYVRIPPKTVGVCAMTRLAVPLMVVGERLDPVGPEQVLTLQTQRHKRQVRHTRSDTAFDLTINSPTYVDAIGVPRGVPDQYKLADQIAAGFENIPVLSALFPITPNKNVDRINYVHYNLLRLANLTRDAVGGLKEQLAPTSLMTIQNRMALDMLLAEKGGVCFMFQESCCTFIPNNTAPDGSVTRALEGLRILSNTMHEHSDIDAGLDRWFSTMFGKWKGIVMSLLVSVATFVAIIVTCGCCCVPCIRSLIIRLIAVSIEKGSSGPPPPPPYQMLFRGAADGGVVELGGSI